MKGLDFGRHVLGGFAAAAMLAGCGGSEPIAAPGIIQQSRATVPRALERWQLKRPAYRVCAKNDPGEAQCLALVLDKTAQPNVAGWAPADFQARYELPSSTKGKGQIVAIVDAYDNPNVASDLSAYRSTFDLGTATFSKFNQDGQQGNYPTGNTGWGVEIDLDAEMVSATCPLCTIYLIEANSAGSNDLEVAESEAVKLGAHIVSNSWTCYGSTCVSERSFDHKGVTYLAAGGSGYRQEGAPAFFDRVVSVGGTTLSKNGSQYSESISNASLGGCATGIKKPKWQHDKVCAYRLANDAAAVAWNVAEYNTYGYAGWFTVGGTSVAAPLLAGVFGLAGNAANQDGGRTFWQKTHRKYLYDLPGGCSGGYTMGQYTTCDGWGSPKGIGAL